MPDAIAASTEKADVLPIDMYDEHDDEHKHMHYEFLSKHFPSGLQDYQSTQDVRSFSISVTVLLPLSLGHFLGMEYLVYVQICLSS